MGRKTGLEAAECIDTNHPRAAGRLTGNYSTFLGPRRSAGGGSDGRPGRCNGVTVTDGQEKVTAQMSPGERKEMLQNVLFLGSVSTKGSFDTFKHRTHASCLKAQVIWSESRVVLINKPSIKVSYFSV